MLPGDLDGVLRGADDRGADAARRLDMGAPSDRCAQLGGEQRAQIAERSLRSSVDELGDAA